MFKISDGLSRLQFGAAQTFSNLAVVPLVGEGSAPPSYLLLDAALTLGCARITEVSESGSVPELRFDNRCEQAVLLLDGEELVGAKQNRILNLTVLVPARTELLIPVSCVEQGRWSESTPAFSSAERTHFSSGRASKLRSVSASMRSSGERYSDQSEVWAQIAEKSERLDAPSATDAAAALYERHQEQLEAYRAAISAVTDQVGAVFLINGQLKGLELFDCPQTLASVLPKLVESFALDAIDQTREFKEGTDMVRPEVLVDAVANAEVSHLPAIGLGEDWRLTGSAVSAAALVHDDALVHLIAFPEDEAERPRSHQTRFVRASRRRHRSH